MGFFAPKPAKVEEAVKIKTDVDPDHGEALAQARKRAAAAAASRGVDDLRVDLSTPTGQTRSGISLSA